MSARQRLSVALPVLVIGALSLWLLRDRAPAPAPLVVVERPPAATPTATTIAPATLARVATTRIPEPPVVLATDGVPYMPASPDAERPRRPVHPHPVTAEHSRIFRENHLIQGLNDAMDSKDAPALRAALATYRDEFPEDAQGTQSGYELIANCLEHGDDFRRAAQRYFDEERGSSLRRFVRRHCLGGP